jgi:hypothetical protein
MTIRPLPDEDDEQEEHEPKKPNIIRLLLLGLIILILICVVVYLVYTILLGGNQVIPPTPTPAPGPTGITVIITPEAPTATSTRVVVNTPTPAPTEEPTAIPEEPTATSTPLKKSPSDLEISPIISAGQIANLLKNDGFETGFDAQGVGLEWHSFKNDAVTAIFSGETPGPYVQNGVKAQRITLSGASQPNRYAGIYQQVNIAPGQVYTLTLYGQIRTGFADVNRSSYGYRLQYALDHTGGNKWQDVPEKNWVELPWDEQLLDSPDVKFLKYTVPITSTSSKITLFARAWNKWADPGQVQYTLDSISLVGPKPVTQEALINQPLPTTGAGDVGSFIGSGRFWIALLVLLLLATGAIYRGKWNKI